MSVWIEILLDKFAGHRPTERLLAHWHGLDLDVAAGTVAELSAATGQTDFEETFVKLAFSPLEVARGAA